MITYDAKITKDRDQKWLVEFPDLPGCLTEGKSLGQAQENALEALNGYLEARCDRNLDFAEPKLRKGKNFFRIPVRINTEFAILLRQLRKFKKLTQTEVAKRLGISQQAYAKLETPAISNPSLDTIQRVSKTLNFEIAFNWEA